MPLPDYGARSIVNLMGSVLEGLGGADSPYRPLDSLRPEEIAEHCCIVLMVIDGLIGEFRAGKAPGSVGAFLEEAAGLRDRLTTVFPSTTATAVTTFLTGDAPQQHGLTGWHMYLRELGAVMAVLPGRARYGGPPIAETAGLGAERLFGHRPFVDRIREPACIVSPARIAGSDFNRAHAGGAEVRAYESLDGMLDRVAAAAGGDRGFRYVYAYWPDLDGIGHAQGMGSQAARAHLRDIERGVETLVERLKGTGTLILVTADHGQVDTAAEDRILLQDHPDLAETLLLPLCGEPRAAYCYVRAGAGADFEAYVREQLSQSVELRHSAELIESGLFGLGTPHPRVAERIGDYTLIMRERHIVKDWLPFERPFQQIGVHGGLSDDELYVPLSAFSV